MTVARFPGEFISGEKITYQFGRAVVSRERRRYIVALNLNGRAYVTQRWVATPSPQTPAVPQSAHDTLDARSARGEADHHKDSGQVHTGSHREHKGVLTGSAIVRVTTPRAQVEYRAS